MLGSSEELRFERELDDATGFDELVVSEGGGRGTGSRGDDGETRETGRDNAGRGGEGTQTTGDRPQPPRTLFGWIASVIVPPPRVEEARGEEREGVEEETR